MVNKLKIFLFGDVHNKYIDFWQGYKSFVDGGMFIIQNKQNDNIFMIAHSYIKGHETDIFNFLIK
jgi:hypothetical protein